MTLVKICGLTRSHDVHLAVSLGAWACGFVLCPSSRQVDPMRAAELALAAGSTLTVGVVATESPAWIAEALAIAGLGAVQLAAGAEGASVAEVRAAAEERGLRPRIIAAADTPDAAAADAILLDARLPHAYGGTGRTVDWAAVGALDLDRRRLVLAGGLRPDNVGRAIDLVRPLAVDVSGGVESAPGRKDSALLRAFFGASAAGSPPIVGEAADAPHSRATQEAVPHDR